MKKISRLPHEQASDASDGLPLSGDVEGHGLPNFLPGMPGTGGDNLVRPVMGGEDARHIIVDEPDGDDVEGHFLGHTKGERFGPGTPGTGGDQV